MRTIDQRIDSCFETIERGIECCEKYPDSAGAEIYRDLIPRAYARIERLEKRAELGEI